MTRGRRRLVAAAGIAAFVAAGHYAWTRVSAHHVLRRFVREMGIPVEIRAASWDARIGELLAGKIRNLDLDVYYEPLKLEISVQTPVTYKREGIHWSIQLEPTLAVGSFPPARGKLAFEFDAKPKGRKTRIEGIVLDFDLMEKSTLKLASGERNLAIAKWNAKGRLGWNPRDPIPENRWRAEINAKLSDVTATSRRSGKEQRLSAKHIQIASQLRWPDAPPFPVRADTKVRLESIEALVGKILAEEPKLEIATAMSFDGKRVENATLSIKDPVRLDARAAGGGAEPLQATVKLHGSLNEIITRRAASWLTPIAPALRRAKASGSIDFLGRVDLKPESKITALGKLAVDAASIDLPARDVSVTNAAVELPLAYPDLPAWGRVRAGSVVFRSVALRDLSLSARASVDGIDATTEDDDGVDRPIRQSAWGGRISASDLYAHVGGKDGLKFAAAISGGPFQLSQVQKDLCLAPDHPLNGQVSFSYPELVHDADALYLIGKTDLTLFNGTAQVGDIRLFLGGHDPKLRFNVSWSDLDLHAIGEWTRIGDIRGSLEGSFKDAEILLTPIGPVPSSYDLTLRGRPRGGSEIRFYGRAVDSTLKMLGDVKANLPGYQAFLISVGTFFRNLRPVRVSCLGFRAKADNEWTELSTFDDDPECRELAGETAASAARDKKPSEIQRYLLRGDGFNIPLNTHGVYPVIMKTVAFHNWVRDRIKTIGGLQNERKKPSNADEGAPCAPPW